MHKTLFPLLLVLSTYAPACRPQATPGDSAGPSVEFPALPDIASNTAGWLQGDLHLHTTYSDGFDSVATTLALAGWLEDDLFLAAHPEYTDQGLDFLAFTDHDNVSAAFDPDFTSQRLVLIPGAEWTFRIEEANLHGIVETVRADPDGDGVTVDDVRAIADLVHAQGANFSINHPMTANYPFPWDVRSHDSVEVWNTGWAFSMPPADEQTLADWQAAYGEASPFFKRAVQEHSLHAAGEALALYEAMLSRGVHSAMVGGSDRHVLYLPGFPTTWVHLDDGSIPSTAAVLAAVRARHTFVTRNPAGPQVLLSVTGSGTCVQAGDPFFLSTDSGSSVEVELRTARAPGGRLELIGGPAVESDEALDSAALGQVLWQTDLSATGDEEQWVVPLTVVPGDWLYARVLEPLVPAGQEENAAWLQDLARAAAAASTDVAEIALLVSDFLDVDAFSDPGECDPDDWDPLMFQCVLADPDPPGSFFIPDPLNRALNALTIDGEPTEWCMGGLVSAVVFTAHQGGP